MQPIALFKNMQDGEIDTLLHCLGAEKKQVKREEILLLAGDTPLHVGVVLAGRLHIVREDFDGNRTLMGVVHPNELFAEALCCAGVKESPVTVLAAADATVLLLRFDRILRTCPNSCVFHQRLVENMLQIVAGKTLQLQSRLELLVLKTVRTKVLRYLECLAQAQGRSIVLPFNREKMAEFLGVERSALSHELAKMKRDGLIVYEKNRFELKE